MGRCNTKGNPYPLGFAHLLARPRGGGSNDAPGRFLGPQSNVGKIAPVIGSPAPDKAQGAALNIIVILTMLVCLVPSGARSATVPAEIDYLISAVGSSGCSLTRNGARHNARDATTAS